MTLLMIGAMTLLGGTTWLALVQPITQDPARNRRLTGAGLLSCLLVAVLALLMTAIRLL